MRHHIVSIGISKHKNSTANLSYAEKDATEFFTLFTENIADIGFSRLLVDQEAALVDIKTALGKELFENLSADDAFIFFYSGHGALVNDPTDPNTALSYLVPYDTTSDIANSCISVEDIKNIFESLPCKTNLIFIDSCFSGSVSKGSKAYPLPNKKGYKDIKSFTNTLVGNGSVIFTASKDDEESIEDPDLQNGLFTYYLIEELQKDRTEETYSVMEIFSPIVKKVTERASSKWAHTQTPTFSGKLEGDLKLPVFKKSSPIKPQIIEIPKNPELDKIVYVIPELDFSEDEIKEIIQNTAQFVISTTQDYSTAKEINYEKLCTDLVQLVCGEWGKIFLDSTGQEDKIPEAVSKLEAQCFQLMVLGSATTLYGNDALMKIFSKHLISILELTKNRAGLIALIAVPEIIILEMIYIVTVLSISRDSYKTLKILLDTKYDNYDSLEMPPVKLIEYTNLHYTRALGGYSTKVNDHIREFLKKQEWLFEFSPRIKGNTLEFQLQANLLIVILTRNVGQKLWPDYARFYAQRVLPFFKKIKYDSDTQTKLGELMEIGSTDVRTKIFDILVEVEKTDLDKYHWVSLKSKDLMTTSEE
ncbi:MAG: caspase family protein [Candidatus Dadabacteria bacterium]|nr:caspase family protein [Candidatus Dadabacteria bacterium]